MPALPGGFLKQKAVSGKVERRRLGKALVKPQPGGQGHAIGIAALITDELVRPRGRCGKHTWLSDRAV
ncbi:hypothetical protein Geu3261_0111_018 [Komagataeibacter europaeus NBRC 3261]|uniref:Uncharacterized protein n=1 Tax=Komagataeibacter europaeus NBRC 3261 TaxID=1234669 RepID=A0A0D6Q1H6_KOMEU|nr:hypothetical protein Geu3261_0111_018 [Komagataeibacter europaeus NBRC 3261]